MKKELNIFWKIYKQMNADMAEFAKQEKARQISLNNDTFGMTFSKISEYEKSYTDWKVYSKNPLLYEATARSWDGKLRMDHPYQTVVLFKDAGGYNQQSINGGKFFDLSDKIKVLHTTKDGYEFCLVRDIEMFIPWTNTSETYWGHRFQGRIKGKLQNFRYKYGIRKDGEVIFSTHKKWFFNQEVLNKSFESEGMEFDEDSPSSYLRTYSPFKTKILSYKFDFTLIHELSQKAFGIDTIHSECTRCGIEDYEEDFWIVFIMGLGNGHTSRYNPYNISWVGFHNKTKPTEDDVMNYIMVNMEWYNENGNDLVSLLNAMKEEGRDMNNIKDFYIEERLRYLWFDKMDKSLSKIFNTRTSELLKGYFENVSY